MAMLALITERPIANFNIEEPSFLPSYAPFSFFNPEDEMDINFMDTFDHAVTQGDDMSWLLWARRNQVEEHVLAGTGEGGIMISFMIHSPYISNAHNKVDRLESSYLMESYLHNGEENYIEFLFFIMSLK